MKKLIFIIYITISFNSFSFTNLEKMYLSKLVRFSEEIIIVDIIQIRPRKMNCGYLVEADIVHSFKGKNEQRINFWIRERDDILDDLSRYLVFASTIKDRDKNCIESLNRVGGITNQTMFPVWYEKYILAGRQSFLTSTHGFYDADEFVQTFKIHNNRIYAVANLEKIKIAIEQQVSGLE